MFDNIGEKIKGLAKVTAWIGIIASWIAGFSVLVSGDPASTLLPFLLIGVLGSLVSWASSFVLYAYGEMAENIASIENDTNYIRKRLDMMKSKMVVNDTSSCSQPAPTHRWRCLNCGEMISQSPCPYCKTP